MILHGRFESQAIKDEDGGICPLCYGDDVYYIRIETNHGEVLRFCETCINTFHKEIKSYKENKK